MIRAIVVELSDALKIAYRSHVSRICDRTAYRYIYSDCYLGLVLNSNESITLLGQKSNFDLLLNAFRI